MKHFLIFFVFGILCQNILARGLDNPVFHDLERRLVRLEARQFSERESLEHRMLQLETQLGTQQEKETPKPKLIAVTREEQPSKYTTFLQRLENVEKRWEKELEEQLAKFSSKYESLTERFSAFEKQIKERSATFNQTMESYTSFLDIQKVKKLKVENTSDAPKEQTNYEPEQGKDESEEDSSGKFKKIGEKYYIIENKTKIWWHAFYECILLDAHLVILQNEEEWSALKKFLKPDLSYWIDIHDMREDNHFISEFSGDKAPFLKWEESDPKSLPREENCVELRADYDHKMNDVYCRKQNFYICEKFNR